MAKQIKTKVTEMLGIEYPILQGCMQWIARAELVAAVSEAGGLGIISSSTFQTKEALQEEINEMETTASSGGGAVSVKVNGKKELVEINLQPEVVDPDDIEMLQDLILTAVNEALRQMEEISNNEMNKLTGSLGLPAGLL